MAAMPASSIVTGAVKYWDLDEGSGNVISDSVTGDLASVNGATWVDGLTGTGLSFDGVDDYVGMSDSVDLRPASLTVSLWMKINVMKDCGLVIKRMGTTGPESNWQVEMFADGDLRFSYNDGSTWNTLDTHIQPITDTNRWYNIVMTFDSGEIVIYVDGSIRNSGGGFPALDTTYTGQVQFGRGWGGYFNGVMDEITLHDRALSQSEINADFQTYTPPDSGTGQTPVDNTPVDPVPSGESTPYTGVLKVHWDFDHMQGSDVLDVSGNDNDAGTSGGAEFGEGVFWDGFVFTGENFMEAYNTDDLNMEAFTIEFWLNPSEYGDQNTRVMEKGGYQVGGGFGIEFNRFGNHNIGFLVWDGADAYAVVSDGEIPLDTWTHVIASFDGENIRLYIDGEAQGQPVPAAMSTNTAPMYVGRAGRAYTDLFVGQMDELKLWEGGVSDTDVINMMEGAEPSIQNKIDAGMEDLAGTLLNSKYFYYSIGAMTLLFFTLIAILTAIVTKKGRLMNRFKEAKEAGFNKEFQLGDDDENDGKHIEGQELLAGWKEAITSSSEAENFIKVETLNEYKILETRKFWGVKVSGDKETETFTTSTRKQAGIVPNLNEGAEPQTPTDYTNNVQEFAVAGVERKCTNCDGVGDFHCTTCDGDLKVSCPDCSGQGVSTCSSCSGSGGHRCSYCDGHGSSNCSVCDGNGTIGGGYGATTWTTTIDNKGSHSEANTSYSEKQTCYSCHGSGKSSCFHCDGGEITCSKCKGEGTFNCKKCETTGIITCPTCTGTGRMKCNHCGGWTVIAEVDYKKWTYEHHNLEGVNKDIPCEIKEKEYQDDELGSLNFDDLEKEMPGTITEKEKGMGTLEWARNQYNSWEVGGDKILFERFKARLLPVTGIKVKAPPSGKKNEDVPDFWLWTVGGRSKSRLYAHDTPAIFNTSFSKIKIMGLLVILAELALMALLILMAFDIFLLPL